MTTAVLPDVVEEIVCTECKFLQPFTVSHAYGSGKVDAITVESAARSVGWRVWNGETLGGGHGSMTLCPVCAGTANAPQAQKIKGWDAECSTCGLTMSEDCQDDHDENVPFSEAEAKEWQYDHECEPAVHLVAPVRATP